jgi:predicted nucleotidyltransferase
MNKKLKSFGMQGQIHDDSAIPRLRSQYEQLIESDMREQGYVPILDLDIQFSLLYDEINDIYDFDIVVYGVYVGKKKAHLYEGFSGQNLVPKQ